MNEKGGSKVSESLRGRVARVRLEITEQERGMLLTALIEYKLDQERYASSYGLPNESGPGPLDSCCDGHLARYEARQSEAAMFRESVKRLADLSERIANTPAEATS